MRLSTLPGVLWGDISRMAHNFQTRVAGKCVTLERVKYTSAYTTE
ncbi:hypothetical protein FTUN_7202 [Frigoriglobus tundricola]|uniref:Uncharacterized protein n=1 Tax=Frigoriglobus tundricola TaxID=2774151 RepID=A0A6M5Z1V0_9BACT|nr:hypothetical protein FTUN_7202 [Frigoriglobus tundricola]